MRRKNEGGQAVLAFDDGPNIEIRKPVVVDDGDVWPIHLEKLIKVHRLEIIVYRGPAAKHLG